MGRVAKMPADGYSLLMVNPSYVVNPTLHPDMPYRFEQDFDPVSLAVLTTLVIAVHPSVPARTLQRASSRSSKAIRENTATRRRARARQVISSAKSFRSSLGLDLVHVPFNSAGLAVGSAVGRSHADLLCLAIAGGAASDRRQAARPRGHERGAFQALPDVPTTAEAGYPAVTGDNWQGIIVPAGTPKDVIRLPASRDCGNHGSARCQRAPCSAGLRACRQHAGGIWSACESRI